MTLKPKVKSVGKSALRMVATLGAIPALAWGCKRLEAYVKAERAKQAIRDRESGRPARVTVLRPKKDRKI